PLRDHHHARPAASDVPGDRRLRPFRPQSLRDDGRRRHLHSLHLGTYRQGRRPASRRRALTPRQKSTASPALCGAFCCRAIAQVLAQTASLVRTSPKKYSPGLRWLFPWGMVPPRIPIRRLVMSGKPAARVGDPTACPKTGHGNNPITSGSPDVLFDGLPAARQGDPTGCGSALTGDLIANVLINGKPVATLDSLGDHGNVIIGGSGSIIIGNTPVPAPFSPPAVLNLQ